MIKFIHTSLISPHYRDTVVRPRGLRRFKTGQKRAYFLAILLFSLHPLYAETGSLSLYAETGSISQKCVVARGAIHQYLIIINS
jgi:hypothetical protein